MLLFCVTLFNIEDRCALTVFLLLAVVYTCGSIDLRSWNKFDWTVAGLFLYNIIATLFSENIYPSLTTCKMSTMSFLVYHVQKDIIQSNDTVPRLQRILFVFLCAGALCIVFASFLVFSKGAREAGFTYLLDFRHLFRPLGYNTNVWNTVLLLLLGLTECFVINRKQRISLLFSIMLLLILSFSRSAYIAVMFFVLLNIIVVRNKNKSIEIAVAYIIALGIGMLLYSDDVFSTIRMASSEAQRRSTEGRLLAMRELWSSFQNHWYMGYGAGNFTFAMDSFYGQDSTKMFTSYAPNILIKILVERGIIGVVAFILFIIALFVQCWKKRRNHITLIAVITLIVLFLKDMALATVSTIEFGWIALAIMLAFIADNKKITPCPHRSIMRRSIIILICIFSIIPSITWTIKHKNYTLSKFDAQQRFINCLEHQERRDSNTARNILCSLVNRYPNNAQYSYQLYKAEIGLGNKDKAFERLTHSVMLVPRILTISNVKQLARTDSIRYLRMKEKLLTTIKNEDSDPVRCARYGMLAYLLNDKRKAMSLISSSTEVLPNLPLPWLIKGLLLREKGKDDESQQCFRKYQWLTTGISTNTNNVTIVPPLEEHDLWEIYSLKYMEWYGKKLNIEDYEN